MVSEFVDLRGHPTGVVLPLWPLYAMFGLVPLWWLAGAFYAVWPLFGLILLALAATRGAVRLPPGSACWLVFLALVALSAVRIHQPTELASSALRFIFYLTALVVCVYVFTVLRDGASWRRVSTPLMLFWLALVALGWVGVLLPGLSVQTPVERLLPSGLSSVSYVHDLVHLYGAELKSSGASTARPSAPFPYTNNWGSSYALLVPCVLAYLSTVRSGWLRRLLLVSLPFSLPPAFLTLNRGMFVSLGVALLCVAVRALWHGRPRLLVSIAALAGAGILLSRLIPIGTLISQRTTQSASTADRMSLYSEVLRRIVDSPLLGYGAPANVDTITAQAPVGTQGQLWLVLFSHGVPALLVFLLWFLVVVRAGSRDVSATGMWLAAVPLAALVQLPFYGLTYQNLSVLFFAAGLSLGRLRWADRAVDGVLPASTGHGVLRAAS